MKKQNHNGSDKNVYTGYSKAYSRTLHLAVLSIEEIEIKNPKDVIENTAKRMYNLKDVKITPVELLRGSSVPGMLPKDSRAEPTGVTTITIP